MAAVRFLATCNILMACSSADMTASQQDAAVADDRAAADVVTIDASSDAKSIYDAHAPAAPSCPAGDRQEWSGAIPNKIGRAHV